MLDLIREVQQNPNDSNVVEITERILSLYYGKKLIFPVKIVGIAESMEFRVFLSKELDKNTTSMLGVSSCLKEAFASYKCIFLNEYYSPGNRRFSLACQLGYYLFDFNETTQPSYSHIIKTQITHNNPLNNQVIMFANELIMPKRQFKERFIKFKSLGYPAFKIIAELSDYFNVTHQMILERMESLDLHFGD